MCIFSSALLAPSFLWTEQPYVHAQKCPTSSTLSTGEAAFYACAMVHY